MVSWIVTALAAGWIGFAFWFASRLGIGFGQALVFVPVSLALRIDISMLRPNPKTSGPVIHAISHQSAFDAALMMLVLPKDTLHILDPRAANNWLAGMLRSVVRSVVFSPEQLSGDHRLLSQLKTGGQIAVYLPKDVEPDAKAFRLFRIAARLAKVTNAAVHAIHVGGSRQLPSSYTPTDEAPRRPFGPLRIATRPPQAIGALVAEQGVAASSPANALFDRLAEARVLASNPSRGLYASMAETALRFGTGAIAVEDTVTGALSRKRLLIGSQVFARRFADLSAPGEAIGVLLPNANGAVVAFFALQSAGRVAAMLNYTAGSANIVSALTTAKIRTVISSRAFIEKAELDDLVAAIEKTGTKIVWLEDVRGVISTREKLLGALTWRWPLRSVSGDDPAVILFTSGSEGTPKAVVLSHANLQFNAAQAEARVCISVKDTLFNVLPVFHSFGLTGGTILPLLFGVKLFLYPSPLHYKIIPQVAAKVRPTIMFGTDTFLSGYARAGKDSDFDSLRFVVAGAEAVKPETRRIWKERFDATILEGFGMTEAAPVVAVNTASHSLSGTVGRPLPLIETRLEPVEGIDAGGRLWVKGPNVMLGYMTADMPGQLKPLEDGWHDSGDIISFEPGGYIAIRGRAKRFAKIAGEMVSLGAIEMLVESLWPEDRHAAVSVPDKRKGERIILITTHRPASKSDIQTHTQRSGAPELMIPGDVVEVAEIPMLGSGKTDYAQARKVAFKSLGIEEPQI